MIIGGINRILRRAPTRIGCAERLLVPDLGPVAIARLALHRKLNSCARCLLLEQLRGIDRTRKGNVGDLQDDRAVVTGLLVEKLRFVRIITALFDPVREQRI